MTPLEILAVLLPIFVLSGLLAWTMKVGQMDEADAVLDDRHADYTFGYIVAILIQYVLSAMIIQALTA